MLPSHMCIGGGNRVIDFMHPLSGMRHYSNAVAILKNHIADAQEHPRVAAGLVSLPSSTAISAWTRWFCRLA